MFELLFIISFTFYVNLTTSKMSPVNTLINIRDIIIINGLLGMSYLFQVGRKIEDTRRSICRVQELQLAN